MANITTQCPFCKQKFNVGSEWTGLNTQCPSCGKMFVINPLEVPVNAGMQINQADRDISVPPNAAGTGKSTASLVLGIINCLMWLLPIIGIPVGIVGLILGCKKRYMAGIILNAVTLTAAVVNSIIGAILGAQGKLF